MTVDATIKKIRNLNVHGAENIAKAALGALKRELHRSSAKSVAALLDRLGKSRDKLEQSLPEEPCMRNALNFVFYHLPKADLVHTAKELCERIDSMLSFFHVVEEKIAIYAYSLVKEGSIVFTHSFSSTVVHILEKAKRQKKDFQVYVTETRPYYLGRETARQLSGMGIPVTLVVDSAVNTAMEEADICLFGCDAITGKEIFGTMGIGMMTAVAERHGIPVYFCSNSWKFDPIHLHKGTRLEERRPSDVWEGCPKKVRIRNHLFESVDPHQISSIVSELGRLSHHEFLKHVKKKYPWMARGNK